jgi:hypothetical protein
MSRWSFFTTCSLASRTFQATYIISVVVNPMGLGEVLFERLPHLSIRAYSWVLNSRNVVCTFGSLGKAFFFLFFPRAGVIKIEFHTAIVETKIFSLSSLTKKIHFSHLIKSLTLFTGSSRTAMRFNFYTFALLTCTFSVVNAHFQLAFPPPRGPFVDDNEVNFCGKVARFVSIRVLTFAADNYVDAVSNRSEFPLTGGFFTLNSEHPSWSRTSKY